MEIFQTLHSKTLSILVKELDKMNVNNYITRATWSKFTSWPVVMLHHNILWLGMHCHQNKVQLNDRFRLTGALVLQLHGNWSEAAA